MSEVENFRTLARREKCSFETVEKEIYYKKRKKAKENILQFEFIRSVVFCDDGSEENERMFDNEEM